MIGKRIIPCLDVRDGRVVKGTNFEGVRDVADPVAMARCYNESCADELVFYDITASSDGRALFADVLSAVASEVFIPLTVGGGVRTLEDFDRVLKAGADKVSVNSELSPIRRSSDGRRSATAISASCCPWTSNAWTERFACSRTADAWIRASMPSRGRARA